MSPDLPAPHATFPRLALAPVSPFVSVIVPVRNEAVFITKTLCQLLEQDYDRSRFEVRAYSYGPDDGSPMRRRLMSAFDAFSDVRERSHAEAAQTIHADGVMGGILPSGRAMNIAFYAERIPFPTEEVFDVGPDGWAFKHQH